ncbi:MAG: GP88 family protein [Gemmataceae bacterium]
MSRVRPLLAVGNGKLGRHIAHFDLPAVATCPGRSAACEGVCYATRARFRFPTVRERLRWCYEQSRRGDFVRRVVDEARRTGVVVLRLHVSGDFYSPGYAEKWLLAMRRLPRVRHFFYTRSWRVPAVEPWLRRMALLGNCRVWFSCDRDTGVPAEVPEGVRLAWLQDTPDAPPASAHLAFRTRAVLDARLSLPTVVCPNDTPQGRRRGTTCGSCGLCWGD